MWPHCSEDTFLTVCNNNPSVDQFSLVVRACPVIIMGDQYFLSGQNCACGDFFLFYFFSVIYSLLF